jgi:hypothetical protein
MVDETDNEEKNETENDAKLKVLPPVPAPAGATSVPAKNPPKAPEKTADRPHTITIGLGLLGLLSPLVAFVALYISIQSLRTNVRSLEIGQRAYVSPEPPATLRPVRAAFFALPAIQSSGATSPRATA